MALKIQDNSTILRNREYGVLEMDVDESEKGKYKITLPLSSIFECLHVDVNGCPIPISSVEVQGPQTIIKVSGSLSKWKLKLVNLLQKPDISGSDGEGTPVTRDGDENGDWLLVKPKGLDDNSRLLIRQALQQAKQTIIFQQVE